METDPKQNGLCWSCRKPVAAEDNFCRFCGKGLRGFPWYYRHWGIILLSLLALGPFGLILVWRSPALSRAWQWIYTAAIMGLTYYLAVQCYQAWLTLKSVMNLALSGALPIGL